MFRFEISVSDNEWREIPEEIFYDSLYRYVRKITPHIKDMLNGEIISFGHKHYRIRCEKRDS